MDRLLATEKLAARFTEDDGRELARKKETRLIKDSVWEGLYLRISGKKDVATWMHLRRW